MMQCVAWLVRGWEELEAFLRNKQRVNEERYGKYRRSHKHHPKNSVNLQIFK